MPNLVLVRPPAVSSRHAYSVGVVPPIGLAYVASALRAAGNEVAVIDALGEAPLRRGASVHPKLEVHGLPADEIVARIPSDVDGVGLSVMFSQQWPDVERLVAAIRVKTSAPIFLGGEHVSACWEYVLERCPTSTLCVFGEGEESAVEVAEWIAGRRSLESVRGIAYRDGGALHRTPPRPRLRAVDAIPRPAWDLFPIRNYLELGYGHGVYRGPSMPILATRGCPYQCTFCSSPEMWGTRYHVRAVSEVVDEIETYIHDYGATNFDFFDLTAIIRRQWILDFCRELRARGLRITYQLPSGTRSEALDPEVLEAMYETGCRNITYAPESGSPRMLKLIKKRITPERILESMRSAKQVGINVKANLMIGFPDETRRDLWQTLTFGLRAAWAGVDDLPLFPFSPYPGSALYDELVGAGAVPPPSDAYFADLSYSDMLRTVSFSRHFGTLEMNLCRIAGMAAFHAVGYARRPWRIARSLRNFAQNRSETVVEQRVLELARRRVQPLEQVRGAV